MRRIALVAARQDPAEIDKAVDQLPGRRQVTGCRSVTEFRLPVVLEKRYVIDRGFDTQHDAGLVRHLDRCLAEAMFYARLLDPGRELRTNLLGQLRGNPMAEEAGPLRGIGAVGELYPTPEPSCR
jgi:hypothetical protein